MIRECEEGKASKAKNQWGTKTFQGTVRHEIQQFGVNQTDKKTRGKLKEREQMSKLFTKSRRKKAKKQFKSRLEMTLQKKKIKKRELEKKYYDYNFKPNTNKKRINIYSRTLPDNVIRELEKKKELKLKKKIREQQETAFGTAFCAPFQSNKHPVNRKTPPLKFMQFSPDDIYSSEKNIFDDADSIPLEYLDFQKEADFKPPPGFIQF